MEPNPIDSAVLRWESDGYCVSYSLWGVHRDGQTMMLGGFDQGPFDTALEVAQWAWRMISRVVPPASC